MQEISTQAIFLIEGLTKSSSASDRRQVLSLATVAFDHYDVPAHDSTVKAGGVPVLALWLEKIFHLRADPYDVDATCRVLLFLLRCSESQAVVALSRSGTDLVLVLFQILLDPVYRACITADDTAVPGENPFLLLLERIGNIPWRLEETKRSDQLLRSLQSFIRDTDFPHFVRYQAIRLLANLTAFSVENKLFVPRRPSLLDDIVKAAVANEQLSFDAADKRDWDNMVSAFFLNLGWCACNVSIMLATRGFLDLMIAILRKGQDSSTLKVLECFAMLAREAPAVSRLANGQIDSILQSFLESSLHPSLRETSLRALCGWTNKRTASFLLLRGGKLSYLIQMAKGSLGNEAAAQTLKKISRYLNVGHSRHAEFVDGLVDLSRSTNPRIRFCVAKAFVEQTRSCSNGFYLLRMPRPLATLIYLAKDSFTPVRTLSTEALLNLSSDRANAKRITLNNSILQIFIERSFRFDEVDEDCQAARYAVQALLLLASHRTTQDRVAKHLGIVAALGRFGVSKDSDHVLRKAALHGVIVLAPLM